MSTKLYHTDVFIPDYLRNSADLAKFHRLDWSKHAQKELVNDRYGMIPIAEIPQTFAAALGWQLVELETGLTENDFARGTVSESITKYVFRRPVDETRSLVIVLRPTCCGKATVVTCWTNLNSDKHNTLDKSKYENA